MKSGWGSCGKGEIGESQEKTTKLGSLRDGNKKFFNAFRVLWSHGNFRDATVNMRMTNSDDARSV